MLDNKKVLAVVPARGGSKGIPNKNISMLCGVPLVGHVGNIISRLTFIDRAIISTDSKKIADIANQYNLEAPFFRPERLSGDFVSDIDVLKHALMTIEEFEKNRYDIVIMLQPTSPLRKVSDVINTVYHLIKNQLDAVWTISETDSKSHPLKQLVINDSLLSLYDEKGKDIIARQQLSKLYHRNGVAYAITRKCLLEQNTIFGKNTGYVLIKDKNISIDTMWDLELVEYIMNKKNEK